MSQRVLQIVESYEEYVTFVMCLDCHTLTPVVSFLPCEEDRDGIIRFKQPLHCIFCGNSFNAIKSYTSQKKRVRPAVKQNPRTVYTFATLDSNDYDYGDDTQIQFDDWDKENYYGKQDLQSIVKEWKEYIYQETNKRKRYAAWIRFRLLKDGKILLEKEIQIPENEVK